MSKKGTNWTEADLIQKGLTAFEDSIYSNHKVMKEVDRLNHEIPVPKKLGRTTIEKKSKYNNKKVVINGLRFDSTKEGNRYLELKEMQENKEIFDLQLQPCYECIVNGMLICRYNGDFKYNTIDPITTVVEDVKGMKTPVYKLKKKLMKAIFNIEIKET